MAGRRYLAELEGNWAAHVEAVKRVLKHACRQVLIGRTRRRSCTIVTIMAVATSANDMGVCRVDWQRQPRHRESKTAEHPRPTSMPLKRLYSGAAARH